MSRRILPHSPWRPGKARCGKVARLPEKLRETVNLLLLDGLTYDAIIAKLGEPGKHLTYHNLKRWRQGGYQDWLLARQHGDRARIRQQCLQKLTRQTAPRDLASVMTSAVANQYMQFFLDFDCASLKENLEADAGSFVSLVNSLAKMAHAHLDCAKARRRQAPNPLTSTAAATRAQLPARPRSSEHPSIIPGPIQAKSKP